MGGNRSGNGSDWNYTDGDDMMSNGTNATRTTNATNQTHHWYDQDYVEGDEKKISMTEVACFNFRNIATVL